MLVCSDSLQAGEVKSGWEHSAGLSEWSGRLGNSSQEPKFQSNNKNNARRNMWAAYSASAARIAWKSRHANRFSSGVRSR
jgi:hypothetical protein